MLIQHLEKLTLLDFPGRVAAVIFTYGCNLRCPYCHNPELVTDPLIEDQKLSEDEVIDFLKHRGEKLDGLVITGGEPTVHKDLLDFIKRVRKECPHLQIKLDTNGTFPEKVKDFIDAEVVDYWAVDIKYPKEMYEQGLNGGMKFKKISETIKLIKESGDEYEFRTTVVKGMHDVEVMKKIGKLIEGSPIYYIQNFRAGKTIDPTLDNSKSFNEEELESFASAVRKYVDKVVIRNY